MMPDLLCRACGVNPRLAESRYCRSCESSGMAERDRRATAALDRCIESSRAIVQDALKRGKDALSEREQEGDR